MRLRYVSPLMVITVFLLTSAAISVANQQSGGLGINSDESVLFGNAQIVFTNNGQIFVEVDQMLSRSGVTPDGVADVVFRFVPRKRKLNYQTVSLSFEQVSVLYSSNRLTIISNEGRTLLHLSIDRSLNNQSDLPVYEDRTRDVPDTIRIYRGVQLSRHSGDNLPSPNDVRLASDEIEIEGGGGCPAGGAGAVSCSMTCPTGGTCSVTCGTGYYACCTSCGDCHCNKA